MSLLDPFIKNITTEENTKEPILGKGLRLKKKVNYNTQEKTPVDQESAHSNVVSVEREEKDPDDTDYDISEGENVEQTSLDQRSDDSFNLDEDKKTAGTNDGARLLSKFNVERDFKDLSNYGVNTDPGQLALMDRGDDSLHQYKHFAIIDGFMPKERMEFYGALMK